MTRKTKRTIAIYIIILVALAAYLFCFMGDYTGNAQGTSVTACAAGDFNFEGTNILTGTIASIALMVVFHFGLKLADKRERRCKSMVFSQ